MKPAIFLDRDGVINFNPPNYVKSWQEFHFLPGALEALKMLAECPWLIVVVTNQSAVGRGILPAARLEEIHSRMLQEVHLAGGRIDAIYVCPHTPQAGCACRKPQPGLLLQAAAELGIDLENSLFVGDSASDVQAALSARVQPVLVHPNQNEPVYNQDEGGIGLGNYPTFCDLASVARLALQLCQEEEKPAKLVVYLNSDKCTLNLTEQR